MPIQIHGYSIMRTVFIVLSTFFLLASVADAQIRIIPRDKVEEVSSPRLADDSASFRFDEKHIKASAISEDDPPVFYRFEFVNIGRKELNVKRLVSTCTCAEATIDKARVAPGEDAVISLEYKPKGHPGKFERKVFVYTEDNVRPSAVLRLSIEVKNGKDMSKPYPIQKGVLRMRRDSVAFTEGMPGMEKLPVVNLGEHPLKLEAMMLPPCLEFKAEPEILLPGSEGQIVLGYNPSSEGKTLRQRDLTVFIKGLGVPPSKSSIKVRIDNK